MYVSSIPLTAILAATCLAAPQEVKLSQGRADAALENLARTSSPFVPNVGQWTHDARFVHRSGAMTVFLRDRGWVLDLVETPKEERSQLGRFDPRGKSAEEHEQRVKAVALAMAFEGSRGTPKLVGERRMPGHHNYFLGSEQGNWRTDVPLFACVRYENVYPRIDVRIRQANGVPEYDLLLRPGADLSAVAVRVRGGRGMTILRDGSLAIDTAVGPVIQPVPKTWQVGADGTEHEIKCWFKMIDAERFGFVAPDWNGRTPLTVDPGLNWSTYHGSGGTDRARGVAVDGKGLVTVVGDTTYSNFPTVVGSYDTTFNGRYDAFVSCIDPSKTGPAQLVYSTFLGGSLEDGAWAVCVNDEGVVTMSGQSLSTNYPTSAGAWGTYQRGYGDAVVTRLDPRKSGAAQLLYSTYFGGPYTEGAWAMDVDSSGVVTIGGQAGSSYPTTASAYDRGWNGKWDIFVARLDPAKYGAAQLLYSTYVGGSGSEWVQGLDLDANGRVAITGLSESTNLPRTSGAFQPYRGGGWDVFACIVDPNKVGAAQLAYSTYMGGSNTDGGYGVKIDDKSMLTVSGQTWNASFPTTVNAFDRTHNGSSDGFVSRLDPGRTGAAQLLYSTLLGSSGYDGAWALAVGDRGLITVVGECASSNFPTTANAFDRTHNGSIDAFAVRLDPGLSGAAQLLYSSFLGGFGKDWAAAVALDGSGVARIAGVTASSNFPTRNPCDGTHNGGYDAFVMSLNAGLPFSANLHELSLKQAGSQKFGLDAGQQNAGRSYAIFGSATGTAPGLNLLGIHIPLNVDPYTEITIGSANAPIYLGFRGQLDSSGRASASLNIPSGLPSLPGIKLDHAFVVFGSQGMLYFGSNAVPIVLKN